MKAVMGRRMKLKEPSLCSHVYSTFSHHAHMNTTVTLPPNPHPHTCTHPNTHTHTHTHTIPCTNTLTSVILICLAWYVHMWADIYTYSHKFIWKQIHTWSLTFNYTSTAFYLQHMNYAQGCWYVNYKLNLICLFSNTHRDSFCGCTVSTSSNATVALC